jgi:mRNA interferase RelE/StbE
MPYTVEFSTSAQREFKALERAVQRRIAARIDELAKNPFSPGTKKLRGEPDHYRVRLGQYWIIYRAEGKRMTIVVVRIGHRREVYR